ncbi:MAG: type II secretion system F family protein [Pirellulaceae bacterium]|nr:type II secretion system F family protein [Pirellulaceae bacterium]
MINKLIRVLLGGRSSWRITPWWGRETHRNLQSSLLRLLAVSHREQLDIAPLLFHFANEHRGIARSRLRQLAKRIENGAALIDALEQTPDALSDDDVLSLRFALHSGTIDSSLNALIDRTAKRTGEGYTDLKQALFYHFGLLLCIITLAFFVMAFILPTFSKLFMELEVQPAFGQQTLVAIIPAIGNQLRIFLIVLFGLAITSWFLKPLRYFRRTIASRWFQGVAQMRSGQLLRMLSLASDAGRPMPGSLSTLARYHFDQNIRSKLLFARNEVELGTEPWKSLSDAHLLSPEESKALADSTTSRTRSWLMRRLADEKEARVRQHASLLVSIVHPILILLSGFMVLWVAFASFGNLVQLIVSLA